MWKGLGAPGCGLNSGREQQLCWEKLSLEILARLLTSHLEAYLRGLAYLKILRGD